MKELGQRPGTWSAMVVKAGLATIPRTPRKAVGDASSRRAGLVPGCAYAGRSFFGSFATTISSTSSSEDGQQEELD